MSTRSRSFAAKLTSEGVELSGFEEMLVDFDHSSYQRELKVLRAARPLDRRGGEFRHAILIELFVGRQLVVYRIGITN